MFSFCSGRVIAFSCLATGCDRYTRNYQLQAEFFGGIYDTFMFGSFLLKASCASMEDMFAIILFV